MPVYHVKPDVQKKLQRLRRARRYLVVSLIVLMFFGVGAGVFFWQQVSDKPHATPKSVMGDNIYYSGTPKKHVGNEVFGFDSSYDWQYSINGSSPPNKYIFFNQKNGVVKYELEVYTGLVPKDLPVSRIMPVTVKGGTMQAGTVSSAKCGADIKKPGVESTPKDYGGVHFICSLLSSFDVTAIGVVGGDYSVPLYNSRGRLVPITITMTNNTTAAIHQDLMSEIVETFKLN